MSEPLVERPAMADYGVPTEPDGLLPWAWAAQRLVGNKNYWVVTASASARPHAMPVWGVWRDDGFWFSCSPNARKARNLVANPQAVVTTDDTVEVVSIEGRARAIPLGDPSVGPVVADYVAKYAEPDKADEMASFVAAHQFFQVVPQRGFGIIEREEEFSQRATRWRWPVTP